MIKRFRELIRRHCDAVPSGAAGSSSLPSGVSSFAETMAAWRFYNNARVEMSELIEPLREYARRQLAATNAAVVLLVHDWCKLSYPGHASKLDQAQLAQANNRGYELTTVLAVNGSDGSPLAPVEVHFKTADGVLSTRDPAPPDVHHLEQVLPTMDASRAWNLSGTALHVIDREADSVNHWRQWTADGHLALVRADDRKVLCQGQETSLRAIAEGLHRDGALKDVGAALYHGRKARLLVAEAEVVLHRPGKRNEGKKKVEIPGPPLPLRLVVTELRDLKGRVLARWLLLTNVPAELADAATIAKWYYFRWRIEGMPKLLKKAGWQLESWLQRNGQRLLIKLLIALGACASIWGLERQHDVESEAFQRLLMQLSGRQTKRGREITTSGLLAGLWVLLGALGALARHGPEKINAMLVDHLPLFAFY